MSTTARHADHADDLNIAVLSGTLANEPTTRALADGSVVAQFDLRIAPTGHPMASVPVAWYDAPPVLATLAVGDPLLVVGRVHRRFFRVSGSTQSRTEVVATRVVPRRRTKTTRSALAAVADDLRA